LSFFSCYVEVGTRPAWLRDPKEHLADDCRTAPGPTAGSGKTVGWRWPLSAALNSNGHRGHGKDYYDSHSAGDIMASFVTGTHPPAQARSAHCDLLRRGPRRTAARFHQAGRLAPAGLFLATVAGLCIQPVPGGALVLLSITLASIIGGLTIQQALAGYADPTVWLVLAAFFISRALINTGLAAHRLVFVRLFGKKSLGVCHSLALSDMLLAHHPSMRPAPAE
jgi:di/tricarboxylate transporter